MKKILLIFPLLIFSYHYSFAQQTADERKLASEILVESLDSLEEEEMNWEYLGNRYFYGELLDGLKALWDINEDKRVIIINPPKHPIYIRYSISGIANTELTYKVVEQTLSAAFSFVVRDTFVTLDKNVLLLKVINSKKLVPYSPYLYGGKYAGGVSKGMISYYVGGGVTLSDFIIPLVLNIKNVNDILLEKNEDHKCYIFVIPDSVEVDNYEYYNPYLKEYGLQLVETKTNIPAKVIEFLPTGKASLDILDSLQKRMEAVKEATSGSD